MKIDYKTSKFIRINDKFVPFTDEKDLLKIYEEENERLKNELNNQKEENKGWSMIFDTMCKRPYAHKYLEQKKKELKNKKIIALDSEMIYKDYYDLKEKIDKAIDFINQYNIYFDDSGRNHEYIPKELLSILKGGNINE